MLRRRMPENLPMEVLRTIVMVADLSSYKRAADRLDISNPAVNAQIARMTRLVGFEIFFTQNSMVVPTNDGRPIVEIAREIISLHDRLIKMRSSGI